MPRAQARHVSGHEWLYRHWPGPRPADTPDAPRTVTLSVSGSRRGFTEPQLIAFIVLLACWGVEAIVHGDCIGVDATAHEVCRHFGILSFAYPGSIPRFRAHTDATLLAPPAYPTDRNWPIVRAGDVLAAFPRAESRGTWDAIRKARFEKRLVVVVGEDGRVLP
jgi:hypothetical protein